MVRRAEEGWAGDRGGSVCPQHNKTRIPPPNRGRCLSLIVVALRSATKILKTSGQVGPPFGTLLFAQ